MPLIGGSLKSRLFDESNITGDSIRMGDVFSTLELFKRSFHRLFRTEEENLGLRVWNVCSVF